MPRVLLSPKYAEFFASSLCHGAVTTQTATANRVYLTPFQITKHIRRLHAVSFELTTVGGAGALARLGLYDRVTTNPFQPEGAALLFDSGNLDAETSTGVILAEPTTVIELAAGLYWGFLVFNDAACVFRRWSSQALFGFSTSLYDLTKVDGCYFALSSFGAPPATIPAVTVSVNASPNMGLFGK